MTTFYNVGRKGHEGALNTAKYSEISMSRFGVKHNYGLYYMSAVFSRTQDEKKTRSVDDNVANIPKNLLLSCTTPSSRLLIAVCALVTKGSLAAQENLGGIWCEGKDTLHIITR